MRFGMLPMGDISAEPSMEEILSSIKRIIAEEGDGVPGRQRRPSRVLSSQATHSASHAAPHSVASSTIDYDDQDDDEVLELSDPMPMAERPRMTKPAADPVAPEPRPTSPPPAAAAEAPSPRLVSRETAAATRAPLEALTRLMVKPDPGSDGTLEGLVREMLRPMLREWMDANLPDMVEDMVAREIARITGEA